jgi:c-di-GMP-binding flagellar brake protein YcgR
MEERRKFQRIVGSLPLKLGGEEVDIVTETVNIGGGGLYCKVNKYIPVMTKFKVIMLIPEQNKKGKKLNRIDCEAIVVRIEPEYPEENRKEYNIALFFNQISKQDRQKIEKYVSEKKQETPP